jgi:hypothetical protein
LIISFDDGLVKFIDCELCLQVSFVAIPNLHSNDRLWELQQASTGVTAWLVVQSRPD